MYGAQLIAELRRREPETEFFGAGGQSMRQAGCDTVVPAEDLAVVGITEILSHLPKIYNRFHHLIKTAEKRRPDVAVVIDSPAFNWRVAREMRRLGVPVVYYVCPQFWAWRQGRVRLLQRYVTKALVIFPFEEQFYRTRGVDTTFVGHPLAALSVPTSSREAYAAEYRVDVAKDWVTIMPGSREKEVSRNLPTILETVRLAGWSHEYLLPVASTLKRSFLESFLKHPLPVRLVPDARAALAHSRAGIIASGTATVEAAMIGTPFVMVYRVSQLTYLLGRSQVKVPHFAMVNLIAGEEVVPELVQHDFTPQKVLAHLNAILPYGPVRGKMLAGFDKVKARLQGSDPQGRTPAAHAADIILQQVRERRADAPSVLHS
ncbi:MAG: lipid-A-disaccharide synthase [Acidobacteriales bacterium]|nr:lipid-A-disaccharide synthase [Terriglobales bacterium]